MAILRGRDGTAYVISTTTAFTSEATTETAKIYQINTVGRRIWNPNAAVVVSATAGGLDLTWGKGGIDYFTGRVKLTEAGATVAVSGEYVSAMAVIAQIFNWQLTLTRNMADVTPLGTEWRDVEPLGLQATVSIGRFRTDTAFDYVTSDPFVLFKLEESSGAGFWVLAHRTSLGWTKSVGAVDQEALTFEAVGPVSRY